MNITGIRKITWTSNRIAISAMIALVGISTWSGSSYAAPPAKAPAKPADKTAEKKDEKTDSKKPAEKADGKKPAEKAEAKKPVPEVVIDAQSVSTKELIDKPHEYLNKNVRFLADFASFSSLALDYKPAMRASKQYLSFLITNENSKIPLSEIKLAMVMPKENDKPRNELLTQLKEGDQIEITGKVFSTALDEPWLDVLNLKKLKSAPDHDKDKEKKASADDKDSKDDKDKDKDKDKAAGPGSEIKK